MVNDIFKSAGIDLNEPIELTEEKQKIVDSLSYESKPVFRSSIEPQTNYGKPNSLPREHRYTYKDMILTERYRWWVKEFAPKDLTQLAEEKLSREEHRKITKRANLARRIYKRIIKWLRK